MYAVTISGMILISLGLGFLVFGSNNENKNLKNISQHYFFTFGIGICLLHLGVQLRIPLVFVLLFYAILALLGYLRAIKDKKRKNFHPLLIPPILFIFFYSINALFTPIYAWAWDSWSQWFFHGKIIYFNGKLQSAPGLNNEFLGFTNPAYPKMNAALSALSATLAGQWNDFIPKTSLLLIMLPAIFGVFAFFEKSIFFIFFSIFTIFGSGGISWIGYMDGFIWSYLILTLFFAVRFIREDKKIDFLSTLLCLAILTQLKNEGTMILAIMIFLGILFIPKKIIKNSSQSLYFIAIIFSPTILWKLWSKAWNLNHVIGIKRYHDWWPRIFNETPIQDIFQSLFLDYGGRWKFYLTAIIVGIFSYIIRKKWDKADFFILGFFLLYFSGTYFVYIVTPWPIRFHLSTSADRVSLILIGLSFAASLLWIKGPISNQTKT